MRKFAEWTMMCLTCLFFLPGPAASNDFLADSHWDSGMAEFQVYEGHLRKYSIVRDATVKIILVKEPLDPVKLVKTRHYEGSVPVIKMNYIQRIPTGIYDYFQTVSIFFERSTGRVLKYTMSSQDGCGNTFMEYLRRDDRQVFRYQSYYDDQGDTEIVLENGEFVFYDALPVFLRFRITEPGDYNVRVMDSLISNKALPLTIRDTIIRNGSSTNIRIRGKKYSKVLTAEVLRNGKKDVFWFEPDYPHRLIRWKKHDRDELVLDKSHFFYYWRYVKPKDRTLGTVDWGK